MHLTTLSASLSFLALLPIVFIFLRRSKAQSTLNFPPGPPPIPILGNLHQIPLQKSFLQFAKWSEQYGPIIGLHLGPQKAIILNSWRAVRDLLDQRGAIYSSRPDIPIVQYVVPGDLHLVFMKYDRTWRKTRKTITDFLRDDEVDGLIPIQDAESTQMIWEVLHEPEKYYGHVMRAFGAVILASVYGQRGVRGRTEQFFVIQDEWAAVLDPGAMPPFEVFPFLRYVPDFLTPWRGWRERAADLKGKQSSFYSELFQEAKAKIERGKGSETLVAKLLKDQQKEGYSEIELEYIAGFLIEGGADTTALALLTFIVAMAKFPDIQKQVQDEVDREFGEDMPHKIDGKRLSYLQACFWETLRWRPGFPTAIPHATSKDDTYQGYFIPAGTTVIMNTWAIQHDPDDYPNGDSFDPSRFFQKDQVVHEPETNSESDIPRRQTYAFGAGRRICAGQRMAENSMMMSMAKLVWAFDISPIGEGLLDTSMKTAWKDAILTGPQEVPLNFKVRGESRKQIIEGEWERANTFLKKFE